MNNVIEIWEPRYKDNVCLIAMYKVRSEENYIRFTKAKHLAGMTFMCEGYNIKQYPLETNGKIECYAVPMDKLVRVD